MEVVGEKIRLLTTAADGPVGRAMAENPGTQELGMGQNQLSTQQVFIRMSMGTNQLKNGWVNIPTVGLGDEWDVNCWGSRVPTADVGFKRIWGPSF